MHFPTLVVVQSRLGSTRLPGKVLFDLAGRPLLVRLMERLGRAERPDGVVIATTTDREDDPIAELCSAEGWECFRGHATDLLDRHYQCARHFGAEVVAKIPSDVPLIDPAVVDEVFARFASGGVDYASNLHPPSFPDGQDVEVFSLAALEEAWRCARKDYEREHTTPYIWDRPDRFRLGSVLTADGVDYSLRYRWTIDYPEDHAFLQRVFADLHSRAPAFTYQDVIAYLEQHPDVAQINAHLNGVNWYRHHLDQLKHVDPSMTKSI